jgi:outer membrane receptor protein involved in Fe transport
MTESITPFMPAVDNVHTFGTSLQSVSKRHTADAYLSVNLNYKYQNNDFGIFMNLRNVANEDTYNPDSTTGNFSFFYPKADPGMNYLASIKITL